ncbi:MAG: efflux RND transporter periplasmic adaptor subunit [Candidatus Pacebacteria bacterium]|nr:efflux RND transporter periplasmic adaptor subunit [Candidatus Paceibacterota bacterium]
MKKKKLIIWISVPAAVVVLIAVGVIMNKINKPLPYEFTTAKIQNIIQEVSITGKVKPANAVDLAFEKSGRVAGIYADVGDAVEAGDALAALDTSELQAQLKEAKAQLEIQQANLQELEKGARSEELGVLQTKVANAEKALADVQNKADSDLLNLYSDVADILHSAYASADDAVNKQIDDLFSNANTDNPQITFQTSNSQYEILSEQQRVASGEALKYLKNVLDNLDSNYDNLDAALIASEQKLVIIRDFLNVLTEALNASTNLTTASLNAYKGYVNTSRTNVNSAITEINTQKQYIASQKITNQQNITASQNSLKNAQKDLELKQAKATVEQIQAQEAQVKAAQANVQNLEIQISKATLRSPIKGLVTKQTAKIGQIITANSAVVSVISEAKFQVEANTPEADIAKVKINDPARITLDAYGSDVVFEAMVIKIDPAETVVEGVPTYKTTFEFKEDSEKIKSGMTANIDILTAQKENALTVPYRAVIAKNGDKMVRVVNGKDISERKVTLGLRGSDGNIEILEGLREGEKVITFEKNK